MNLDILTRLKLSTLIWGHLITLDLQSASV